MFEFLGCQIEVPPQQMSAIVRTESSANQYAIGIVGHYLSRQPQSLAEAEALVIHLKENKINFSVGLAQVNQSNFEAYKLSFKNLFNPCENLRAGSQILKDCYNTYGNWSKAFSCYYSGNPTTGFSHGYVREVLKNLTLPLLTKIKDPDLKLLEEPIYLEKIKKNQKNPKNRLGLANDSNSLVARRTRKSATGSNKVVANANSKSNAEKPATLHQRRLASSLKISYY